MLGHLLSLHCEKSSQGSRNYLIQALYPIPYYFPLVTLLDDHLLVVTNEEREVIIYVSDIS